MDLLLKKAVAEEAGSDELVMLLNVITTVLESQVVFKKKLDAFGWLEHILDNNKENIQDELGNGYFGTSTYFNHGCYHKNIIGQKLYMSKFPQTLNSTPVLFFEFFVVFYRIFTFFEIFMETSYDVEIIT